MSERTRDSNLKTIVERPAPVTAPTRRATAAACIVVIYGVELGRRAEITRASFEIGRSPKCDLCLDQESVSRQHARITWDGNRHIVEDLGSTNGTIVNEQLVKQSPLKDGDQIKIGRSILKFMTGDNIEANYHEEIYRLMTVDALTQTHNRRYFNEALEREFTRAQRYKRALSLLLFDIDFFKKINDTLGHVAGDSVLRQVGLLVKPKLRAQDILARVGGEEFAVLLPEVDRAGAMAVGEKIRRLIEAARFSVDNKEFTVTVSVGVAQYAESLQTATAFYDASDQQLYAAKHGGRNKVCG